MNPKAQQVINYCMALWPANQADCSGFVKAVCAGLGVAMSPGQADDIVAWFRDPVNNWTALSDVKDAAGNITTRKEQQAKDASDNGQLVMCGLTSVELGAGNGHVAIIISGPLVYSGQNANPYPTAYWGTLGGVGGANQSLAYSFGVGVIDQVTYAAFTF